MRRCHEDDRDHLSACISDYMDDKINCSIRSLKSNKKKTPCHTQSDLNSLYEVTKDMIFAAESKIYQVTGCMPSCSKSEFELINIHRQVTQVL